MGIKAPHTSLSPKIIFQIFSSLYATLLQAVDSVDSSSVDSGNSGNIHYCSLQHPCAATHSLFSQLYKLKLVSKDWNCCFLDFCSARENKFFRRVEDAYYPHAWHINTKIRKAVLLGRYRIFNTIDTEDGERGVFQAFDFKVSEDGCSGGKTVIVKGWLNSADGDCVTEGRAYETLRAKSVKQVPALLAYAFDKDTEVHALVIEKLGPTLEDILQPPGRTLDEKSVLAVAIQTIDCYAGLHAAGIIHNGVKPGNICLSSDTSPNSQTTLNLIDFGLSYFHDLDTGNTLPAPEKIDAVGNRQFLSVYGHHGISQSQRDDLESLGYLFSFLYHGFLPWDRIPDATKSTNSKSRSGAHKPPASTPSSPTAHTWCIKMATPGSVLFRDMDPSFLQYWKDVKSLAFGEKPDYVQLKSLFVECWKSKEFGGIPGEINWFGLLKT